MARRRRRRGTPGWARAKDVLVRMLRARGIEQPWDRIGRSRFIGDGLSYLTYAAACELPDEAGELEELTLVVRLPRYECADELVASAAREARLLEHLSQLSLPLRIPRPIDMVPADPGMAPVQTAVFGIPLDFKNYEHAIEMVAEVAAIVHGIDPAPLHEVIGGRRDRRAHAEARLTLFEQLEIPEAKDALSWAEAHLPPASPARLLHGDLLGQNILRPWHGEQQPPGLIDWEYATIGDPARDLAIATRGARRPFGRSSGLQTLVEHYNAKARDQLSVAEVQLHELALIAGYYKATADERGTESPTAEHERNRLRLLLRRCQESDR